MILCTTVQITHQIKFNNLSMIRNSIALLKNINVLMLSAYNIKPLFTNFTDIVRLYFFDTSLIASIRFS